MTSDTKAICMVHEVKSKSTAKIQTGTKTYEVKSQEQWLQLEVQMEEAAQNIRTSPKWCKFAIKDSSSSSTPKLGVTQEVVE